MHRDFPTRPRCPGISKSFIKSLIGLIPKQCKRQQSLFFFFYLLRKGRQGLKRRVQVWRDGKKENNQGRQESIKCTPEVISPSVKKADKSQAAGRCGSFGNNKTTAHLRDLDSSDSRFQNKCFLCKFMKFQ